MQIAPLRGEVWLADFEPVRGHEQGRTRPALILSHNTFNSGAAGLVVVVPTTTTKPPAKLARVRPEISPRDGGLPKASYALPEQIRAISANRLISRYGKLSQKTLAEIEDRVRDLLVL